MKLAYLMQCHKNPKQIKFFIDTLNLSSTDSVIIHIDSKRNDVFNEVLTLFQGCDNVYVIEKRTSVNWSGCSQLFATISMIDFLHSMDIAYDYCLLLSGEDIVFDSDALKMFLQSANEKSFIEYRNDCANYYWRINKFNVFRDNIHSQRKLVRILSSLFIRLQRVFNIKRNNFTEEDIHMGSQWFTISHKHMSSLLFFFKKEYLDKFSFTSCSDEHFFQMLFKKHINTSEYVTHNMRYIHFPTGSSSPSYLSVEELNLISKMPGVFISRKVTFDTLFKFYEQSKY